MSGRLSVETLALPPLVVGEQDGAQLGQLLRRILERREHERPLVERQREQLHFVGESAFEPVSENVVDVTDEVGEVGDGVTGNGASRRSSFRRDYEHLLVSIKEPFAPVSERRLYERIGACASAAARTFSACSRLGAERCGSNSLSAARPSAS